jgi:hypothetical protein
MPPDQREDLLGAEFVACRKVHLEPSLLDQEANLAVNHGSEVIHFDE